MNISQLFNLKNKTAVITGGAGHLGTAMSEALAEAGVNIVIASINVKKCRNLANELSKKYKVKAIGIKMDISSGSIVKNKLMEINREMGTIDILINNAFYGAIGQLKNISEESWQKSIDGTINAVFRCTQAVIPYFEKQGSGSIINIASMYGVVSPDPRIYGNSGRNNPPNYGAGKAAVIQFTKYCACHLATKNIRVNSITPGAFPNKEVQKNTEFIYSLNKKVPLGRIGKPEDLKGIVLLLASDASSYITGTNIIVDGGWTAW